MTWPRASLQQVSRTYGRGGYWEPLTQLDVGTAVALKTEGASHKCPVPDIILPQNGSWKHAGCFLIVNVHGCCWHQ